jgi:aminopeptidase N
MCAFCEDIVYSESGVYEFRLTAPADWIVAASGERVDSTPHADGSSTHLYRTGPVRDLALALSPDFRVQSQEVDGVTISVYALPDDAQAEAILQTASQALQLFNARFGPYPYASLDLLALVGPGSAGLAYPGWIHLRHPQDASLIPALVSREVAHQWWYGVVGNDVLEEPWLDEALAEYSVVLYLETVEGAEAAQQQLQGYKDQLQRLRALEGFDRPVGSPAWAFAPSGEHLSDIVRGKGALFMDALRQEIGEEAFLAGWRTYYERYRFGVATGRGFLEAMQQAAGQDLRPFFEQWVGPFPESE